ncbi:MAG: GTPase Era [Parvibaculales bacterium]
MSSEQTKFGFIAVIGPPNAGKSTLANALIGQKVSIVTHKAQTTRARLRGVVIEGGAQIVLVDTPGVFDGKRKMDRAMVQEAWAGAEDADAIAVVLDASRDLPKETEMVLAGIQETRKPVILVLNKVDAVRPEKLLGLADELRQKADFRDIFMISALKEEGLFELRNSLVNLVPEGPWHYPEDMAADVPSLLLAAEITREKLFLRLHQELPYALTVETEKWTRRKDGSVRVEQVVYVRRDTQKAIVLGKGGRSIKEIGAQARLDMEEVFGHRVHLFVFVKVRENWIEDPERMRMMGITSPF